MQGLESEGVSPRGGTGGSPLAAPAELTRLIERARDFAVVHAAKAVGEDEAEDIAQRLALTLWQAWASNPAAFVAPDPLEHWVAAGVRRRVMEAKRRQLRAAPRYATFEALRSATRHHGMAPDATIDVAIVERRLAQILDEMSPKQRESFFLARDQELSYREIAARSGGSERTVNTHVTRAMSALRRGLAGYADATMLTPRVGRPGGRGRAEGQTND